MDKRNYTVTNKIFDILDNVKGFDVAMSNPQKGTIILRYEGINFYLTIDPIYNDNDEGRKEESKPFESVVKTHDWVFR